MSEPILGKIIDGPALRDAIHVAVAPLEAGEDLNPCDRCYVQYGIANRITEKPNTVGNTAIGIVDPYLDRPVRKGERFWLFLMPKTITGLRHCWSHPEFGEDGSTLENSEVFLRRYSDVVNMSYEGMMAGIARYLADGTEMDDNWRQIDLPENFWEHYQKVTGVRGKGEPWMCCPNS